MNENKVLIIIPAYNEEGSIQRVVNTLIEKYPQYDYVVINDGSKDKTSEICHSNGFNIVDLPINLGLAGAFQTGMKYAFLNGYEYALQFDGDGQHLPEYIAPMLEQMQKGYDIVIGSRFVTEKKSKSMRMLGSNLISGGIFLSTGHKVKDPTSGMRMFNRKMIDLFAHNINYGPEPDTISFLMRNGAKISEVQVRMEERTTGVSYLSAGRAAMYMIRMMCSILIIQSFRKKEGKGK